MPSQDIAQFSVIIPAHNEETVIARCLEPLYCQDRSLPAPEVIVVANGCSDRTAETARSVSDKAEVIQIAEGSKTRAMNVANDRASFFPRIYLDADVQCSKASLHALAATLSAPGAPLACVPASVVDLTNTSFLVRAYYRVWRDQPYAQMALGGAGCFAVSRQGAERIGRFPDIIADDYWAMSRFAETERQRVSTSASGDRVNTIVSPPRTALEHIRVEARRRIGNEEVQRSFPTPHLHKQDGAGLVKSAFSSSASWLDAGVFLSMKAASKIVAEMRKLAGNQSRWVRDSSSRQL